MTNVAACRILGIENTVYIGDRNRKPPTKVNKISGMYIDDFVEGAKDDGITKTEYERKRDIFIKHRCAIKEDLIQEKQKCINYAGKIYQGLG